MQEGVILLHGILGMSHYMNGISKFLESRNYKVLNINYPSTKHDISSIVELIHPQIKEFSSQMVKVHYVGHSMGGLIIRAYLNLYQPDNLGRVVMLGTPNKGSELADFLKNSSIYKKLYGPSGQQLITDQTIFKNILGNINYELGIISGRSSFYIIANKIIDKESDGRVSIVSTQIEGMQDHVIIKSGHVALAINKKAWKLTFNFLNTGRFI